MRTIEDILDDLEDPATEVRDDAIQALYKAPPESVSQPSVLKKMREAYAKESDAFLKAGLGRLIKLRTA